MQTPNFDNIEGRIECVYGRVVKIAARPGEKFDKCHATVYRQDGNIVSGWHRVRSTDDFTLIIDPMDRTRPPLEPGSYIVRLRDTGFHMTFRLDLKAPPIITMGQ